MAAVLNVEIIGKIKGLEDSLAEAGKKLESFGKQTEKIGKNLSTFVTAPLVLLGGVAVNQFSNIEKGLREVNTLFGLTGEAAKENLGDLAVIAKEASKELGILQSDVVPGLYNSISAGVPKENALDFIKVAGKAAIGGVTDLNTSVDGLTSILNAFQIEFSEAGKVADSVFAAVQGGKTTFEEIAASIFQVAPAAAAAKVPLEEVNAAIATLTAGGTPTRVATTQIRAALTGLQRPSEELDSIFQKLGFQNAQLAIESKGLVFALDAVKSATGGNNGQLQQLLGSVEAVAAANVLAGTGAAKFAQEMERQANAAGAANQAFEEVDQSFARSIERTKVLISNISIGIGEKLAPAVRKLNEFITTLLERFQGIGDGGQKFILIASGIAAAIGPVLLVVGKVISFLPTLASGLKAVRLAFVALSGPIGLIVVGIGLLVLAVVKNWDKITETLQSTGITKALKDLWETIKTTFAIFKDAFVGIFQSGKDNFSKIIEFLKPVIKFFVEDFSRRIKAAIEIITNVIGFLGDLVSGDFTSAFQRIKIIFLTIAKDILGSFRPVAEFFGKGGAIDSAITFFDKKISDAQAIIAGRQAIESYKEEVKDTAKEVKKLGDEIVTTTTIIAASGAKIAAPEFVQGGRKENPLSELRQTIKEFKEKQEFKGIFDGLKIEAVRVSTEFTDFITGFLQNVDAIVSNSIQNIFGSLASALGEALVSGTNVVKALGSTLLRSMSQFLGQLGQQLIAFGVAGGAFAKLQLALANPATALIAAPAAIAAGIALTTISGAIGALGRRGLGGSGSGGSVAGVGATDIAGRGVAGRFENIQLTGTVKINGQDLVVAFERAQDQRFRG
jgi:TP901 family phage tail tape measure protein